ncbi:protein kinase domain-containing protein [Amycolatopsis taiwanensis]|uniref:protein kinase domain-containing protein n=1 Tax=Amycolatopsis taiwanensis TaxID=342230 RepID=UPI0004B6CED2|nr:protein kinase [Amycolatopsis taiwanensis]
MDDDRHQAGNPDRLNRLIGGRYRLEAPIGRGGMGTVWSGTDELLDRSVAVKELLLPPNIPENEAAKLRERALREARAMASLNHPNTVLLYDVVREDDQPFMVMELVSGASLSTLIKEGRRLTDQQLAVIIDSTAAALDAAHRAGIVHRDVKPGNVLVGPDGVKLADFGLVRNVAESTMTSSNRILGTPAYIAPEMVLRGDASSTVDLWGLGATVFAAAEGRPPYDSSGDPLITVGAVVYGPVPQHHQDGPIGEVISGLMVKEPELRMPLSEVRNRVHDLLRAAGPAPLTATSPTSPAATAAPARKNSRPSPSRPANTYQATTPGPAGKTGRRKVVFIATAILAVAAVLGAAVMYLPGLSRTPDGSTGQQQTQQPAQPAQVPAGFVPPPVRPTPLPDPVNCQYHLDGKEQTVKPPADGPVSSKGTVLATLNTTAGAIPLLLDRSLAPCTVNSFISLAKQGAFDGVRCAGGRTQWISCGTSRSPGYNLDTESFPGEQYRRGYLMMDDFSFFGTTFSLFFADAQLVPEYTVFGTVSDEGLKVIDSLIPKDYDGQSDQLDKIVFTSVDIQG